MPLNESITLAVERYTTGSCMISLVLLPVRYLSVHVDVIVNGILTAIYQSFMIIFYNFISGLVIIMFFSSTNEPKFFNE